MKAILSIIKWQFVLLISKILSSSASRQDKHTSHTRKVLILLNEAGATIKQIICSLSTDIIDYLGPVLQPRRLGLASHTTNAVRELRPPTGII